MLGSWEIISIILVIIILFGSKKIPELARNMVLGLIEFKKVNNDIQDGAYNSKEEEKV